MESSDILDCVLARVKKEPCDLSLINNDSEMIDEKPDLKNFQLLPFVLENSTNNLRKYEENNGNELNDEIEIVVECEDVKLDIDLLAVEKIKEDSYKTDEIIKIEANGEVKQEIIDDVAKQSNLNIDCVLFELNKTRSVTKKLNNEHNLRTRFSPVHSDTTHVCEICRKIYSDKWNLNRHVKSSDRCISHSCHICGKPFTRKENLQTHINTVHKGITPLCSICEKTFTQKACLKVHIDSVHKGITHSCSICEKTFKQKACLKVHIDSVHNGNNYTCDVCGKKYGRKSNLESHIDVVHNGITHACDICGKTYSQKGSLRIHIDAMHNGITHACDICGKKYSIKRHLKNHIDVAHNGVTHSCDLCGKTVSFKGISRGTSIRCIMVSLIHVTIAERHSQQRVISKAT
uniref:C2H2-type domain-containing protein n=1 Tax=Trichogramma kaykai TaxID=54128 RepID=A0ABD2XAQ0_9HYME